MRAVSTACGSSPRRPASSGVERRSTAPTRAPAGSRSPRRSRKSSARSCSSAS